MTEAFNNEIFVILEREIAIIFVNSFLSEGVFIVISMFKNETKSCRFKVVLKLFGLDYHFLLEIDKFLDIPKQNYLSK